MEEEKSARPDRWTSEDSPEGARPAATLIILRDSTDGGPPQVLMVQRAPTMKFAADAIVFPGGRVDPSDVVLAQSLAGGLACGPAQGLSVQDAASRIAAIRETVEEAGVSVGIVPIPTAEVVAAMRVALHAGEGLGAVLDRYGLSVDLAAFTPFARWCPLRTIAKPGRIYDTRFYVARAPDDAHLATADTTENVRLRWASAAQIIADCEAGRELAIYPTRRNLERLAQGASCAAVMAHALSHPMEMVTPWKEIREGALHLCIPDHLGYPVTSQAYAAIRRA
jgi:8-oxo-dGTP pyrophosphatase MutT (NUDIX family)